MGIDDTAIRDLGLGLECAPASTRLRLPSRIGCMNGGALGFVVLIVLLIWAAVVTAALSGPQRSIGLLVVSSVIVIALLFLLNRLTRLLRHGAIVTITPNQLVIKKHWSTGEPAIRLHLHQVLLVEGRGEIIVAGGGRKVRIGTGSTPEARHAVVEFLTGVIAGHLGSEAASAPGIAGPAIPEATPVVSVSTSRIDVTMTMAATDESPDPEAFEQLVLALCHRFRQVDAGQVHLSPEIPPAVLVTALRTYLDLQDDEVLLGIVGVGEQGIPGAGCALTTKRIYWPGKAAGSPGSRPPRCQSVDNSALPETIGTGGFAGTAIDLGQGRRIGSVASQPIREVLVAYLMAVRSLARGGSSAAGNLEGERGSVRWIWPRVVAADAEARALRAQVQTFERRSFVATRARVTPAIVLACVAVFAAMVARGASVMKPDGEMMFEWGADFGPAVIFDHEGWRLFTSMFLHFGLIHLLANMFCLATAGPLVERFFGHVGFAALYLLSGLGGSIASLCFHPMAIAAGASGAIFGVFGALLGFLAIRHREVPTAMLKPMRGGALAFVGYNTIFGLGVPHIDMAAHLGGLVTGFVCGLLLTAVTRAPSPQASGLALGLRRSAVLMVLSTILAGLALKGGEIARDRILADPQGKALTADRDASQAWNRFNAALGPVLREFDGIAQGINEVTTKLRDGSLSKNSANQMVGNLKGRCTMLGFRISNLSAENGGIQEIREHLASAQAFQLQMLTSIEKFLGSGDERDLDGPRGLSASADAYDKGFQKMADLRDAYFKAHGIQTVEEPP